MTKRTILIGICLLVGIAGLGLGIWNYITIRRTAMVDVIKVLNSFSMKKDMEAGAEKDLLIISNRMDSLKGLLPQIQKSGNASSYQTAINQLNQWQEELQNLYAKSNETINTEVWKRLNPLIDEFAKGKNLQLLIGANGMGTVLYSNSSIDLTDELIVFVNSKYRKGE